MPGRRDQATDEIAASPGSGHGRRDRRRPGLADLVQRQREESLHGQLAFAVDQADIGYRDAVVGAHANSGGDLRRVAGPQQRPRPPGCEAAVRFEIENVSLTLIEHFEQADPEHAWRVAFVNYMPRSQVMAKAVSPA